MVFIDPTARRTRLGQVSDKVSGIDLGAEYRSSKIVMLGELSA